MIIKLIKSILPLSFDIVLCVWLIIGFIIATIVGTVTHELGHCAVAEYLGYEFYLSYGSMGLGKLKPGYTAIEYGNTWVEAGGPFQTILTGTIGLILIFIFRKSYSNIDRLSFKQWVFIFLALFWLRPTFNFVNSVIGYFNRGRFSRSGDEIWIAETLGWPIWSIEAFTGFIGALVLSFIIFKIIPPKQRITFIAAGIAGSVLGFMIWFEGVGEYLMP